MRPWQDQLREMGVIHNVINAVGINSKDNASIEYPCEYPPRVDGGKIIYDRIYRKRTLPDALQEAYTEGRYVPRFRNPKKEYLINGEMPPFYTHSFAQLQDAVSGNGGVLHLCEGDRDTWTLLGVGVQNVAGIFGASVDITPYHVRVLRELGVRSVFFYPDNDTAGYGLAQKLKDALANTSISLTVKNVPYNFAGVVIDDLSDLWMAHAQRQGAFLETVSMLETKKVLSQRDIEKENQADMFTGDLYVDIEHRLFHTTPEYGEDGWSKEPTACPFGNHEHDNVSPASFWNEQKHILHCFKCGQIYLTKDVARAFGIQLSQYFDAQAEARKQEADVLAHSTQNKDGMGLNFAPSITSLIMASGDNPYLSMETHEFAVSLTDAVNNYKERLYGNKQWAYPPIPFPIEALRDIDGLGGNIDIMQRPGLFAILGASGGNKTTTVTSIINGLLLQGYDGIVVSPEWTPDDMAVRLINQGGGMKTNEVLRLEAYKHRLQSLKQKGSGGATGNIEQAIAKMEQRIATTKMVIDNYQRVRQGKLMIVNQFGANIFEYIQMISEVVRRMRQEGRDPAFLVFDYLQLAQAPHHLGNTWTVEKTIMYFKWMAYRLGLIMFVTSQVRKNDTEDMHDDGYLDDTSGMNMRSDQFNLLLTLNPRDTLMTNSGDLIKILHVRVAKNSTGDQHRVRRNGKRKEYEFAEVYVNLDRLVVTGADWNNTVYAKMHDAEALNRYMWEKYGVEPTPIESYDYSVYDGDGIEYEAEPTTIGVH